MHEAEQTPTERRTDPITYIAESWVAGATRLVRDGETLLRRLRNPGSLEHGAVALELAGAIEESNAANAEAARLLRLYSKRNAPTLRDVPKALSRSRRWRRDPKMIVAIATLITALVGLLGFLAHRTPTTPTTNEGTTP